MYKSVNSSAISADDLQAVMLKNQVVFTGANPAIVLEGQRSFFIVINLEAAADVTIRDGNGVTVCTTLALNANCYPLILDKGIQVTGTVKNLVGSIYEG